MLNTTTQYPWEGVYEAAVLETDSSRLPARIETARGEINSRIATLNNDHQGTPEEREAITCALAWIRVLEQERVPESRGLSQQRASALDQI